MPRKTGDAETSMFTRGRIIGLYEGGVPKMMISKKLNIDPKTIRKWILRFEAHGESGLKSIPKPGAHRKTSAFEDVAIAQAVAVTPTISPQEINKMLGLNISAHTIRRRVRDAKIKSRQEKKEMRLQKKKVKPMSVDQSQQSNGNVDGPSLKLKGLSVKKTRKKKIHQQLAPQQQTPLQQAPQQQPQVFQHHSSQLQPLQSMTAMTVQQDGPQVVKVELKHDLAHVPMMENGIHQQYLSKPDVMPTDPQPVQIAQPQYQAKPLPFYGFGSTSGYEFPRIWTPMTNVNVGTGYCETPKISTYTGFGHAEVPQVTHSSVQTTSFLSAAVSTQN